MALAMQGSVMLSSFESISCLTNVAFSIPMTSFLALCMTLLYIKYLSSIYDKVMFVLSVEIDFWKMLAEGSKPMGTLFHSNISRNDVNAVERHLIESLC